MKKDSNMWVWIVIVAAFVAAATTVAVFVLRARQKMTEICDPFFECDFCEDDCDCFDCAEEAVTEDQPAEDVAE